MAPSLLQRLRDKIAFYRLENHYTLSRHRRSTFQSNAVYIDGQYFYDTTPPTSTTSSPTASIASPPSSMYPSSPSPSPPSSLSPAEARLRRQKQQRNTIIFGHPHHPHEPTYTPSPASSSSSIPSQPRRHHRPDDISPAKALDEHLRRQNIPRVRARPQSHIF